MVRGSVLGCRNASRSAGSRTRSAGPVRRRRRPRHAGRGSPPRAASARTAARQGCSAGCTRSHAGRCRACSRARGNRCTRRRRQSLRRSPASPSPRWTGSSGRSRHQRPPAARRRSAARSVRRMRLRGSRRPGPRRTPARATAPLRSAGRRRGRARHYGAPHWWPGRCPPARRPAWRPSVLTGRPPGPGPPAK